MRILKGKVSRALERKKKTKNSKNTTYQNLSQSHPQKVSLRPRNPLQREVLKVQLTAQTSRNGVTSCRNIVKNYSSALVKFAISDICLSFLQPLLKKCGTILQEFKDFIQSRRNQVNCIKGLRSLLLPEVKDNEQIVKMKKIFKDISVVFLKYYCVNWIYNSKISDKRTHLNYRFKMLRRVRDPIHFTYLEEFSSKA